MAEAKDCPMCGLANRADVRQCDCGFDFAAWEQSGSPQLCQVCGAAGETRWVAFHQHIGAVYLMFHSRVEGRLCKGCVNLHFWTKTGTTLLLGWWGLISFFVTPFVVLHNVGRYLLCIGMAAPVGSAVERVGRAARTASLPPARGQLAGRDCAVCGERVPGEIDGRFCPVCSSPVHNRCARSGGATGCRACGAVTAT